MNENEWPRSYRPYRSAPPVNSVGLVMPVRDGLKFFKLAFHSVLNFTDHHYMMAVVDNLSSDETKKQLRSAGNNHRVSVFEYAEVNRSASINLAMRQLFSFDSVSFGCVIAQDAIVEPHWLSNLIRPFSGDKTLGAVCPDSNVGGSCVLFRRKAFETVNGYDESFHGSYEDADFFERLRQRGYTVKTEPNVYVHRFHTTDEFKLSTEYERAESKRRFFERYPERQAAAPANVYKEKTNDRIARA